MTTRSVREEHYLLLLPVSSDVRLAFSGDKQHPVGKVFNALAETEITIVLGIDGSRLKAATDI